MKYYLNLIFLAAVVVACDSADEPVKSEPATKLQSVTRSFQDQDGSFELSDKNVYTYAANGDLIKDENYVYDATEEEFILFSTSSFAYADGRLSTITKFIDNNLYEVISYTYSGNVLSKIRVDKEDNVDTQATIEYASDTVQVFYSQSNGRSFTYRFSLTDDNIDFEKTIDDENRVSSKISNEFDAGINPFNLLGYTDVFFTNYSKNNKVKIESEYFTDQPQVVPVSLEYDYNPKNLPTKQIITYKNYPGGEHTSKAEIIYEYSEN